MTPADTNLKDLLTEIRACSLCAAELPCGPRPVVQVSGEARLLIAGQAPGRRVHETGLPFNDPSGDRLRSWLGIGRDQFYDDPRIAIVPMGFCYPGTGKSGDLPPRPECADTWRQLLLARLPQLELTLAIGQYAQRWHLPGPSQAVTERVRHWQSHWPSILPLPHPSPRNNLWLRRNPWFEAEVLPVLRERVTLLLA
ncbi:uracil-DNA glycosylase family protein [uncultured Marinobacter sp.]|uniref:uracil-DNA glycosylase family protein n=1 Tax=uncultured Marinobacter sp. TaxID=187379 RepID=UPI0030DA28C5